MFRLLYKAIFRMQSKRRFDIQFVFLRHCKLFVKTRFELQPEDGIIKEPKHFYIIKPTRCTNCTNLFCHETLRVSNSSSVHHQEFIHCTLSNDICHTEISQTGKNYWCIQGVPGGMCQTSGGCSLC